MMEAVSSSETSASMNQNTGRNIPEDSNLSPCRRENLKSHVMVPVCEHGRWEEPH
jgi:hypothetical protein